MYREKEKPADSKTKRIPSLWILTWPILIEMFLQFLLGTADTLMVSRISDDAVAVVGISTQLFNAMTILFMTVAGGAGVLIAQKLGAQRPEEARTLAVMAAKVSVAIGLAMSALLFFGAEPIARLMQLEERLIPLAVTYISIVGGGMVLTAAMAILSTAVRNTGNTRSPMYIAIGMNVIHLVLNYGFIFGELGLPAWGLTGVAVSTLVSRLLGTLFLGYVFLYSFHRRIGWGDLRLFDRPLFGEILKIGWPMGINMASWVFSQLLLFSFVAMLGAAELAARTYMNTLESFCFILGNSLAMAAQIRVAHLYGAGEKKEANRSAFRALWIGLALVMINALLIYALGGRILPLFTQDSTIIGIGVSLLALNLVLQPFKMLNMAMNGALTAIGDTRYMMIVGLFSIWLVATGLGYYLSLPLGLGIHGIYIAMIADELIRGLLMLRRWKLLQQPVPLSQPRTDSVAVGS
ncbi:MULTISPECIES: MATE family efflux transporter [Paenibacillus]|uniref:MATE family efflux transporter n=1 Tax=Paenibacillus TaxID=44249 RepID=UPI0022B8BD27|nr:MATE family efflux transporter [Paenibacillus caseinilyticus]MCZ8523546.1 MATE family efflux transporter [Paenibacillus caseinilyticus]